MRYLIHTARPVFQDMLGTLAFYLLFVLTHSVVLAAAVGLAIGIGQAVLHKLRGQIVPGLLTIGITLTIVLGTVSLLTDNAGFLLLKPTIIYSCLGISMLPRGWVARYVPDLALDLLPGETWDRVGWAWAWLMFGTAAANLLLVIFLSPHQAAMVLLVVASVSKLALFIAQYAILRVRAGAAFRARQSL